MKRLIFSIIAVLLILSIIPLSVSCKSGPKALFEASITSGEAPLNVVFTNKTALEASDSTFVFNWDFGDGSSVNTNTIGESVIHDYAKVGTYTVTLLASKKDNPTKTTSMTQVITVTHGPVSVVKVSPGTVELNIGESQTFTTEVSDAFENPVANATLVWKSEAGAVTDQGVFTAGTRAGTYAKGVTVIAELATFMAEGAALITVKPDPMTAAALSDLDIMAGETKQLTAVANDQYGNSIEGLEATWTVNNKAAGSITKDGLYTAPKKAGSFADVIEVDVKQGDTTCHAKGKVTVLPGPLEQVIAAPDEIDLGMGMTQRYVAVGADEYGNKIAGLDFKWSVNGSAGVISEDGLFTAGNKPGEYKDGISVEATRDGVTKYDFPDVTIEPDHLIFLSNRHDEDKYIYDLYIMDVDGSNVEKIVTAQSNLRPGIARSPDGRRLIFSDAGDFYFVNTDGTWQIGFLSGMDAYEPCWSHDGQKIVYQSWDYDPSEICLVDIDGGDFQRLTDDTWYDDYPDWSPDDSKILFTSEMDTSWPYPRIYVMNSDGTNVKTVTTDYTWDAFPQWSPDGKDILFQSVQGEGKSWGIFIISAGGGNLRTVSSSRDYHSFYPCWSPDGNKVVFTYFNEEEEDGEICVINRDGTDMVRLTDNTADDYAAKWLPRKQGVRVSESSVIIPQTFEAESLSTEAITSMTSDAVVRVETELADGTVSGSGFVIKSDGLILTSNHVVTDAEKITVYFKDGSSYEGTVAARDMVHDIALVKIQKAGLHSLEIGDLSGINNGQSVMVLGYPLGNKNVSVTSGLVSSIEYDSGRNITWVQTDSAINPGNSGGPLLDRQGRVIGIVTAKYFGIGIEGMGYAISANTLNLYLPDLLTEAES